MSTHWNLVPVVSSHSPSSRVPVYWLQLQAVYNVAFCALFYGDTSNHDAFPPCWFIELIPLPHATSATVFPVLSPSSQKLSVFEILRQVFGCLFVGENHTTRDMIKLLDCS